jgi:hypothetical protein
MTCDEVAGRLPDETPEILEHLAACPACRSRRDAYARDGELLAAGLRRIARGRPSAVPAVLARGPARDPGVSPPRRLVPFAAAAAMLLGVFALVVAPGNRPTAPPSPDSEEAAWPEGPEKLDFVVAGDNPLWGQVIAVGDAPGDGGTVGVSCGTIDRVAAGQAFTIYRWSDAGEVEVGKLYIDRVEETWSSGRVKNLKLDPRVGDFVVADRLLREDEKAALLAYLFSFRPLEPRDEARVRALLARLPGENAARELAALGAPARIALERMGLDPELRARAQEALAGTEKLDRRVRGGGLDHDVEFLARLGGPRAAARLRRILAGVRPFSREGFPPPGPGRAAFLHDWWAGAKDRVRWNAALDRFEE